MYELIHTDISKWLEYWKTLPNVRMTLEEEQRSMEKQLASAKKLFEYFTLQIQAYYERVYEFDFANDSEDFFNMRADLHGYVNISFVTSITEEVVELTLDTKLFTEFSIGQSLDIAVYENGKYVCDDESRMAIMVTFDGTRFNLPITKDIEFTLDGYSTYQVKSLDEIREELKNEHN